MKKTIFSALLSLLLVQLPQLQGNQHEVLGSPSNWPAVELLAPPGGKATLRLPKEMNVRTVEALDEYNYMSIHASEYLARDGDDNYPPIDMETVIDVTVRDYRFYYPEMLQGELPPLYEFLEQEVPSWGNRVTSYPQELRFNGFPAAEYYRFDWAGRPETFGLIVLSQGVVYHIQWHIAGIEWETEYIPLRHLFTYWKEIKKGFLLTDIEADPESDPEGWRFDDSEFIDEIHREGVVEQFELIDHADPYSSRYTIELYDSELRYKMEEHATVQFYSKSYSRAEGDLVYRFKESHAVGGGTLNAAMVERGALLPLALLEGEEAVDYRYEQGYSMPVAFAGAETEKGTNVFMAMILVGDVVYTVGLEFPEGENVVNEWVRFLESFILHIQPFEHTMHDLP